MRRGGFFCLAAAQNENCGKHRDDEKQKQCEPDIDALTPALLQPTQAARFGKLLLLIVFAVSFGIAKAMNVGAFDMVSILVNPLLEIVCSLALGAVMGWLLTQLVGMISLGDLARQEDYAMEAGECLAAVCTSVRRAEY